MSTEDKIVALLTRHQKSKDGIEWTTACIAAQLGIDEWVALAALGQLLEDGKIRTSKRGWILSTGG